MFRKITADKIFDGYRFTDRQVLIVGEDGMIEDIVPIEKAGSDPEVLKGILSPGLVNCHCHLELSHMKGLIPERTGLVDFVFKVVTERHHSEEEILNAIGKAEEEMIQNGIVAVGDICNNTLTIPQKREKKLSYYNFIESSGWLPDLSEPRLKRALEVYNEFERLGLYNGQTPESQCQSIVPHAPYSVSGNLWRMIMPYFKNKVVSIHNQETAFEDQFFLNGTGDFIRMYQLMKIDNKHHQPSKKSSLQSYFDKLTECSRILLVHNTFTKQEDIDFILGQQSGTSSKVFFCLCVNANQYIENALPPIEMLRNNHCSIVLGTDSLASNWSLNILDEIRTIRKYFPSVPLEEMLKWATSNGAKALNMEKTMGSFEKGKVPGIILIHPDHLTVQNLTA